MAREWLRRWPGSRVTVLERAGEVGTGQTGHNSGVIHAGLYYPPGSLKARLCRAGTAATKRLCREHKVPFAEIGKLVVAHDDTEMVALRQLAERARQNQLELAELDAAELRRREPHVRGVAALLSPSTGIVDYRTVCQALVTEIRDGGGSIRYSQQVTGAEETSAGVRITTSDRTLTANRLIGCAGIYADRLARSCGVATQLKLVPFRGEYYALAPERRGLVSHLIYPVPDPRLPFLGIHVTPMMDGALTLGPNAVLGLSRDGGSKLAVNLRDAAELAGFPGLWRLAWRHRRAAVTEVADSWSKRRYLARARRYLPDLRVADLRPHPAGIRAQAMRPDGSLVEDFELVATKRQLHVLNAPSPAATAALPIAAEIIDRIARPARCE